MEGKIFTTIWGEESYEISVMVDRDKRTFELKCNEEMLDSGYLNFIGQYSVMPIERDGHRFVAVLRRYKSPWIWGDSCVTYYFDCFADGISVSDGKSTLRDFCARIGKKPPISVTPSKVVWSLLSWAALAFSLIMWVFPTTVKAWWVIALAFVFTLCSSVLWDLWERRHYRRKILQALQQYIH